MKEAKKTLIQRSLLLIILVIFPILSYYYLSLGRNYYKENMEMLKPKANVQDFAFINSKGDSIDYKNAFGKLTLFHFINDPCEAKCQTSIQALRRVENQFSKTERVQIVSLYTNQNKLNKPPKKGKSKDVWEWIKTDSMEVVSFQNDLYQVVSDGYSNGSIALVDDKLKVRNYYNGNDSVDVNLLIRHMAMILPKETKRDPGIPDATEMK